MTDTALPLDSILSAIDSPKLPPVNDWHPTVTRDIDMRIARDGHWYYMGSRIERSRMVRLFSMVLRVDEGQTYLVTPQEKLRITVEDAPFVAVLVDREYVSGEYRLVFTLNTGDQVVADAEHPVTVKYPVASGEPVPYVLVRGGLQALISRSAFYQLVEWAQEQQGETGVESCGCFMRLSEPGSVHGG